MIDLKVIKGGREQMAQEALSALLTGNDEKFEELLCIMKPLNPQFAVIPAGNNKVLMTG